jgi:uncharacterized membrane protein YadS
MANRTASKTTPGTEATSARPPMPWFVLGFVALVGVNSVVSIPTEAKVWIVAATTFLLSVALAAMAWKLISANSRPRAFAPLCLARLPSCSSPASVSA